MDKLTKEGEVLAEKWAEIIYLNMVDHPTKTFKDSAFHDDCIKSARELILSEKGLYLIEHQPKKKYINHNGKECTYGAGVKLIKLVES